VFVQACLPRDRSCRAKRTLKALLSHGQGEAESRHLYESGGIERTCLSPGRLLHSGPSNAGPSVEATCILRGLPSPPNTGHFERPEGVEKSLRPCRNRSIQALLHGDFSTPIGSAKARGGFSIPGLRSSALQSKRPGFYGNCLLFSLQVVSSETQWTRDLSTNLAGAIGFACVRRGFSTPPLLRRGSGRSDLHSLGRASPHRHRSFRATAL